MRIALKYGLLISVCIIAWVVIAHLLFPNPLSPVHSLGAAVFFNVCELTGIYLGIKAREREKPDGLTFKEGVNTGLSIAFVYALAACLFFLIVMGFLGSKMMAAEPGTERVVMAKAFLGLFLSAIVLGVIYSTVISFILAKRKS